MKGRANKTVELGWRCCWAVGVFCYLGELVAWQVGFRVALFGLLRLRGRSSGSARQEGDRLWLFNSGYILRLDNAIHECTVSESVSIW